MFLILRYLFGGPLPDPPTFETDYAVNDHALREARERAAHGDWQAARKVVEDAGDDWELRGQRIGVLSEAAAENDGWLYAWLRAAPSDPAAVLIQASMLGSRAGEARGSASAANTTREQFQGFEELSGAAAQVSRRAMALAAPNDPLPWVEMLGTMFADRQARQNSFDEVFAEGRRRDPYNFDLHLTAVMLLCKKWGGSHEQMFATARGVAAAAPPGANAVLLPLFAHFEFAMLEYSWDTRTKKSLKACGRYFRRPDVQRELDDWILKWRAGTPGPARAMTCWQWLALYYTLAGRRKQAKAIFDQLGSTVTATTAWGYLFPGREYGYLKSWMWANRIR